MLSLSIKEKNKETELQGCQKEGIVFQSYCCLCKMLVTKPANTLNIITVLP